MRLIPNILKVALRNIRRKPVYALVNIAGLAVGLACSILVLLYVYDEYSYDRYHEYADRIFRLDVDIHSQTETTKLAVSSAPMGPTLAGNFAEIEAMVRLMDTGDAYRQGDNAFTDVEAHFADSTVFDIFSYEFLKGSSGKALAGPYKAVLTESMARKVFGEKDPIGKTIQKLDEDGNIALTVTGVVEDVPHNSHFTFDMLISMGTWHVTNTWDDDEWFEVMYKTYLLLSESAADDPVSLEAQFPGFLDRHIGGQMEENGKNLEFSLRPLTEIHLYSDRLGEHNPADAATVNIFAAVGLLILLIAGVNFMNLATARSMERAREVGIRKTVGGHRLQLAAQFMAEALLTSLIALAVAYLLCIQLLSLFNQFSGKEISYGYLYGGSFILTFLAIGLGIGLLSGIYPAVVLSRFRPAAVLRGSHFSSTGGRLIRKGLVVFQFALSVLLLTGTIVIRKQIEFIRNSDLGFDRDQMLLVSLDGIQPKKYKTVKQEFKRHSAVGAVAVSGRIPGNQANRSMTTFYRKDGTTKKSNMKLYLVGYDFVETYGLELIAGRNFSRSFVPDYTLRYIINRSALRHFGIDEERPEEAVGRKMIQFSMDGTVSGVVEDFNFRSLRHKIEPFSLVLYPRAGNHLSLKIRTADLAGTLDDLAGIWERFSPDREFRYIFLNDHLDRYYRAERKFSRITFAFTLLAIFIACLGLVGLTGYTVEKRSKEISVRKVLGGSAFNILFLLLKQYLYLIGIAALISVPVAWYLLRQWLQNFAYHATIGFGPFVVSSVILLAITLIVVSWQTTRAAFSDPVESLRTE